MFGFLICALAGALWLNSRTKTERARAESSVVALYQEQGRVALLAGKPKEALVYLAEAYKLGARGPALEVMIAAAARPVEAVRVTLAGHTGKVRWIAYSHDGRRIATAGSDATVRIWNAETGELVYTLAGHTGEVAAVVFSPDDTKLASASWDRSARIWDAATGRSLHTLTHDGLVLAIAFSADGARLATAWTNLDAGTGGARLSSRGNCAAWRCPVTSPTKTVAWSHDGSRIATGGSDGVRICDATTGALLVTLAGSGSVESVEFSHDDQRVAAAGKLAAVWRTTGELDHH